VEWVVASEVASAAWLEPALVLALAEEREAVSAVWLEAALADEWEAASEVEWAACSEEQSR
jgi:hypothetical protein